MRTKLVQLFSSEWLVGKIPACWEEAKIIIIYKKGDPGDIKNYRPIRLLSHSYKLFTRLLQKRMERILDENQPRDQAGFRKGCSTIDHIYTLNQVIEKSNEYNLPLCVGFIDYEKAFDSVEHFAIFDALRKININETYVTILENIYRNASASVHIDNLESEPFPIHRGVRQGDFSETVHGGHRDDIPESRPGTRIKCRRRNTYESQIC
ncbi:endonuclease-reverse transcriptase [Plakobranchus ocellatus]|uniref:Endonuclease-reverse transcriptase n=1 Tax=Plakobranchus ocellatus TaxID=259542 RepID=A0AAV4A1F8_9GAST|nr:endonuclease-reverse transcriptase [Plakobranchus ocellatus]